jgi:uncharacterized protein
MSGKQSYRERLFNARRRAQEQNGDADPTELLAEAAERHDQGYVQFLARELGINSTTDGKTALFWVAGTGDVEAARLLVEAGCKLGPGEAGRATPLMHAAFRNRLEMARFLMQRGAKANYVDQAGDSALSIAEAQGHTEMVALLKASGTPPDPTPGSG